MQHILGEIKTIISEISVDKLERERIQPEDSLLDLGMDSLLIIELSTELEHRLELAAFPLQEWRDREERRADKRYTVASLAQAFAELAPRTR